MERPNRRNFLLVSGKDVTRDDILDAVGLDEISYPEPFRGDVEDCVRWAEKNPDIYVMVRDLETGHIIAYVNAMPVSDECYGRIRSGDFVDTGITPEMILAYDTPGTYCIYFSSIVVHPDYRNTGAFKFLFDAFVSHILKLGEKGVVVGKMLADAVSPVGEKVCKLLGMTRIGDTKHGSVLYEVSGLHLN